MDETDKIGTCQWRYALVNGVRTDINDAQSGDLGECEVCHGQLRARKGDVRVPHWAHVSREVCDAWHEIKGEWHVKWQDQFPADWRECLVVKEQERHIADIKTEHGLVIEFQHSPMNREEQEKREKFYGNMVWVVDGTRLKNDRTRFIRNANGEIKELLHPLTRKPTVFWIVFDIKRVFPRSWLNCSVPVLFDFGLDSLFCLLPERLRQGYALAIEVARGQLLYTAQNNAKFIGPIPSDFLTQVSDRLEHKMTPEQRRLPAQGWHRR